jgi:hypothetical protein
LCESAFVKNKWGSLSEEDREIAINDLCEEKLDDYIKNNYSDKDPVYKSAANKKHKNFKVVAIDMFRKEVRNDLGLNETP